MWIHKAAAVLVCAHSYGQSFAPQSQPPDQSEPVIRISVNLVQLDAVVTDGKGRQVTDLRPEDFEVLQDGKPQAITNLSYIRLAQNESVASAPAAGKAPLVPPVPVNLRPEQVRRTIALVVDDLGMSFESIARLRQALKTFVDEEMQPGDLIAIIRSGAGIGALQAFTADKQILHAAIDHVRFSGFGRAIIGQYPSYGGDPGGASRASAAEQELFAVGTLGAVRYVIRGLRQLPGRKSVVLFSERLPLITSTGDSQVLDGVRRLVDAANRAAAVIYTIDPAGLQTFQLSAADGRGRSPRQLAAIPRRRTQAQWIGQEGLEFLADQTGGFFVYNDNDILGGIGRVLEDQAGYYLVGYRPAPGTFDPQTGQRLFHSVKVRVRRPGLTVRSRAGFLGIPDGDPGLRIGTGESREQQLYDALDSPFNSSGVGLRLTAIYSHVAKPVAVSAGSTAPKKAKTYAKTTQVSDFVKAILYINPKDLTFTDFEQPEHGKEAVIDLLIATFGDNGQEIDHSDMTYTVRLTDTLYQQSIAAGGILYTAFHPISKPGAYQMRVALRDAASKRVGSASQFIEVPNIKTGRLTLSSLVLSNASAQDVAAGNDPLADASSVLRVFHPGSELNYAYEVLNADAGAGRGPHLETRIRLFRDGALIYDGAPDNPGSNGKTLPDPRNLMINGKFRLDRQLVPGYYVFQVSVADESSKNRNHDVSAWQTFELVKP